MFRLTQFIILYCVFMMFLVGCSKPAQLILDSSAQSTINNTVITSNMAGDSSTASSTGNSEVYNNGIHSQNSKNSVTLAGKTTLEGKQSISYTNLSKYSTTKRDADVPSVTTTTKQPVTTTTIKTDPTTLKVLAIGNSFSGDATNYLYHIAKDCGAKEVIIGNLHISGCSLQTHAANTANGATPYKFAKNTTGKRVVTDNYSLIKGIQEEDWDFITVQQVSNLSGRPDTFEPYLTTLINYINEVKTNKHAMIFWHMTWAYQSDSTHSGFWYYGRDQITMYEAIVNATKGEVVNKNSIVGVIPVGTAIQNVRATSIGDTLCLDGHHLDNLGDYIAGMTWVKKLKGWDISKVTFSQFANNLTANQKQDIIQAVNNATSRPFALT